MTLSDIIYEVGDLTVRDQRVDLDLKNFVNRAQRRIANKRNWSFLHDIRDYVIPAGGTIVSLDADFKQLAEERSPITYASPADGRAIPVTVQTRAQLERINHNLGYPYGRPLQYVFLETNAGGVWKLNLPTPDPTSNNLTFHVSAYYFPANLVAATDSNALTNDPEVGEALVSLAKAMALFSVDPLSQEAAACEAKYEKQINLAAYQDATRRLGGKAFRM